MPMRPLTFLLLGVPTTAAIFWEGRLYSEKLETDRTRAEFMGGTAFYGKRWGYSTDASLDTSLKSGDLVFIKYRSRMRHVPDALASRLCRFLNKNEASWDECFCVVERPGGFKYLVQASPAGGIQLQLYADALGTGAALVASVRRLLCDDETRSALERVVAELESSGASAPFRHHRWALAKTLSQRVDAGDEVLGQVTKARSMLELDRSIKILQVDTMRLEEMLGDLSHWMKEAKSKKTKADSDLSNHISERVASSKARLHDLRNFYAEAIAVETAPNISELTAAAVQPPQWVRIIYRSLAASLDKMAEHLRSWTKERQRTHQAMGSALENWSAIMKAKTSKHPLSSAALTAFIYQRARLLPTVLRPDLWLVEDFLDLYPLMSSSGLVYPDKPGLLASGPLLTNIFHARDDYTEEFTMKMYKPENKFLSFLFRRR